MSPGLRSGFIALVGAPNVGKSTLLNAVVGEKVSIVTPKPQTTRNRILGIKNLPQAQLIFVDTPGIHQTGKKLNKRLIETAGGAVKESDVVVVMVEATDSEPSNAFHAIVAVLRKLKAKKVLAINKIDLVEKSVLLPGIEKHSKSLNFQDVIPVSALTGSGLDILEECLVNHLPEGPRYFPETMYTDQPERFIVAEIIREKVFLQLRKELPYSVAVVVSQFKERKGGVMYLEASIWVERQSQKGILVGKGGGMLKMIGSRARQDIERFLGTRVYLDLRVTVKKNWTQDDTAITELLRY